MNSTGPEIVIGCYVEYFDGNARNDVAVDVGKLRYGRVMKFSSAGMLHVQKFWLKQLLRFKFFYSFQLLFFLGLAEILYLARKGHDLSCSQLPLVVTFVWCK
jgi:hypothetical protein